MKRFLARGLACGVRTIPVVALLALVADPDGSAAAHGTAQLAFPTPEQAVDALLAALRQGQTDMVLQILGSNSRSAAATAFAKLIASCDRVHRVERQGDQRATLVFGEEEQVFPLWIVNSGAGWRFADSAGAADVAPGRRAAATTSLRDAITTVPVAAFPAQVLETK